MLKNEIVPLDALSIMSVVTRFMGDYPEEWEKHLKGISRREYNMVHFTPLVQRGESDSPYSLADQLTFDPRKFPNGEEDIATMTQKMEKDFGLLGMTDVVWNHTANNSPWLEEHPDAGYNIKTAPWLESALELDDALLQFGKDLEKYGLPPTLKNESDLHKVIDGMKEHVIKKLNLWQYYVINVEHNIETILEAWTNDEIYEDGVPKDAKSWSPEERAQYLRKTNFRGGKGLGPRYHRQVDAKAGATLVTAIEGRRRPLSFQIAALGILNSALNEINAEFYAQYDDDVAVLSQQLFNRIRYLRLDEDGPQWGSFTSSPFIETYFSRLPNNKTTAKLEKTEMALVNNGWMWGANALKDHAGPDSRAYLRREIIVWSDCVKLRYGSSPEDSPFVWKFMSEYTRLMAKYFAGFRIDNCHSTPIHVAEYLLARAREVRPDIAIFAELFTGSEETDYIFVKRLGISSLIREAMQSPSTQEMSRLVHMHGGRPIGSFEMEEIYHQDQPLTNGTNGIKSPQSEKVQRIKRSPLHALFMDCTHDNEMPAQKRDARDTLPNAALVSICASATGSVMGYDEIYPRSVNIVSDMRKYTSPSSDAKVELGVGSGGIAGVKKLLNQLHIQMAQEGYDETFIHHEGEFITVHRLHPLTRKGIFIAAHTAYPGYGEGHGRLSPVHLSGTKAKAIGCWRLVVDDSAEAREKCIKDKHLLKGLPSKVVDLEEVRIASEGSDTVLTMPDYFPPGSVAIAETWIPGAEHADGLDAFCSSGATEAFSSLDFVDLNYVLYRCDAEERDSSAGQDGVYTIPNSGPLVYAGLQGWWSVLKWVVKENNLGHPICNHLRDGYWALDYIVNRLRKVAKRENRQELLQPAEWLSQRFNAIRKLPSSLLPRYFALVIQTAYNAAWERSMTLFGEPVRSSQGLLQILAMTSIQMSGVTKSASLLPFRSTLSLAAGLPHFSSGWARCWGRDIFIALRGLYIATGRYDDAKDHIKAFASVLKHGLVPNLLSDGRAPRYNARDAVWFFLQNIQDYTTMVPNGISLLQEKVKRRFLPNDDTYFDVDDPRAYSEESTIEDVIQEAIQSHASGISFREANAGPQLDMQMKDEGFNIKVEVDWETGLIFGGNQSNCGTWMDKMGESEKAGSKGVPGTPRDGAAIELTGLLYSTLKWLDQLHTRGRYAYSSVDTSSGPITFSAWSDLIKSNFERCYYIPLSPTSDSSHDLNPSLINRRGIYKDLYLSGKEYEDYQLRPNFPIAMTVAPDLFDPEHALHALSLADSALLGPTGMATLDPSDYNYRPYYDNSLDSADFATAKGRNYHQGPEWLWPTGFFLRAILKFDLARRKTEEERTEAFQQVTRRLEGCKRAIEESEWAGLAELTNKGGEWCRDSSPTQAWSSGCLLDLFWDAREMEREG